jgi:hypothetical protein
MVGSGLPDPGTNFPQSRRGKSALFYLCVQPARPDSAASEEIAVAAPIYKVPNALSHEVFSEQTKILSLSLHLIPTMSSLPPDETYSIASVALTGILIVPLSVLWIVSFVDCRRYGDHARQAFTWMKVAYPLITL